MSTLGGISQNPIQDMQFTGLHWIEASAGSGKTYTLSSLMVRLLMDGYLPKQVVATTFTRAAAAELKSRIRLRLQESYRFLNQKRILTEAQNLAQAAQQSDPLLAKLQMDFANRMGYACERLKLVLQQLDELFVATLDSFSQKLLREFAFESGRTETLHISDEPKQYSLELIHDSLRQWIQHQPQNLIDWLNQAKQLHHPEYYLNVVETALNFSTAAWPETAAHHHAFEQQLEQLRQFDVKPIVSINKRLDIAGTFVDKANKKSFSNDSFARLFAQWVPEWLALFQADVSPLSIFQFYQQQQKIFDNLLKHAQKTQIFTQKLSEAEQQRFYQDEGVLGLLRLIVQCQTLATTLKSVASQLERYLCQVVQQRLPQLLQQQHETTFAMQIQSLAQASQGPQGALFSAAVHSRYPLILVDEFQDTNAEQDLMLRSIWRQPARLQLGCMIMVGDRKQAIYGFRGGDMLTFIQAHAEVAELHGHFYELGYNHRSVAPLVTAVNALMLRNSDFGEQVIYRPVQAGTRPHPVLCDADGENSTPLVWYNIVKAREAEQVAWQILALLQQSAQGQLYFLQNHQQRPLQHDDFAVLASSHVQLDRVQQALEKYRIRVHRPSKRSVFDSTTAQDVAAILAAMQHPHDEARLKRALLSRMLGFNIDRLTALSGSSEGMSSFMAQFDALQKQWREQGFMHAWQTLLNQFAVWENVVAFQSDDNERYVVNLRHLTEMLNQHSQQQHGIHRLLSWFLKQMQHPAQREWELERKLSKTLGVQLLSIHQSKGLEFNIVFLLGSNQPSKTQAEPLTFSTIPVNEAVPVAAHMPSIATSTVRLQRMIQVSADPQVDDVAKTAHNQRRQAELNRLWYVAITRASHRVYAMWHTDAKTQGALAFWRQASGDTLPFSREQQALEQCPDLSTQPSTHDAVVVLQAAPWPSRVFYPHTTTSFTALAPQHHYTALMTHDTLAVLPESLLARADEPALPFDADSVEVEDVGADAAINLSAAAQSNAFGASSEQLTDTIELTEKDVLLSTTSNNQHQLNNVRQSLPWISQAFPKGAQAGNFLHELFEVIDFQNSSDWSEQLRRRFDNQYPLIKTQLWQRYRHDFVEQLSGWASEQGINQNTDQRTKHHLTVAADIDAQKQLENYIQEQIYTHMAQWIQQILHTPIHAQFHLAQLTTATRVAEFHFDLSLQQQVFQSQRLQQILAQYLQAQFAVDLPMLMQAYSARYLTGSIDLLYWYEQRFYIADYKSNFLGKTAQDYAPLAIQHSMTQACYWLQAALYLVALHRYLLVHWPDYDIQQHLGGASYLYLRGMLGTAEQGVMFWPADAALILAIDAALGDAKTVAA